MFWVMRRFTPASVTLALLLGFVSVGAYCFFRERNHVPEPNADSTLASELEHFKRTGTDVQRAFAAGTFRPGDRVERLLEAHPPAIMIHHPPYTTLYYWDQLGVPGDSAKEVTVIARDGKLIEAKTCIEIGPRHYQEVNFFGDGGSIFLPEYANSLVAGIDRWQADVGKAFVAVAGAAVLCGGPGPAR